MARVSLYSLRIESKSPYFFTISNGENHTIVANSGIVAGSQNSSMIAVSRDSKDTALDFGFITPTIVRVDVKSSLGFTGMQGNDGINYASVRSPFFVSSAGYAVYTDTQAMGSYSFSNEDNQVQFIFNATEITYYILSPKSKDGFKSLLTQYAGLTDTSPLWLPRSYGPKFWHNDFQRTSGFPEGVNDSQEFFEDVVDKLAQHRIRASAVMVDRPYGTGTEGWGNFDFDQKYWPNVSELVKNVAQKGLDFQVWVANRAVPGSQLYNDSESRDWLLEAASDEQPGRVLNLSNPDTSKGDGDEDEMPVWEQNIQTYLFHKLLYEGQTEAWGAPASNRAAGFYNFVRSVDNLSRKYTGNGIRSGLLGFLIWGSDCGGYTRRIGTDQPTEEHPVYEVMLYEDSVPRYDYSDDLTAVLRETAQLYHELVPFIQSYIYRATFDGLPVMRALFLETPEDDSIWDSDEFYFFGEGFLVAPITRKGGTKEVCFPKDQKYLEYFNKQDVYNGGDSKSFTLDINSVPVFWDDEWRARLNIEAYPSYNVSFREFQYSNEGSGRSVSNKMETDERRKTICVSCGRISTPGKLLIYIEGGPREFALLERGGRHCVSNVQTLFD
ncbi:glycosyl hydrolases family 31-domain-containing protein [Aspergillus stella-maris]|uniref:glycosyl hydrolases family 31-domain-containing protein n=1 Tax=Aspergillus stella-maris TaxID=1810926 RepID=UPI003CCD59CA